MHRLYLARYALVFLGLSVFSGFAFATGESVECSRENFSACLNGVGSSVSNGAGLRVSGAEYGGVARERSGRQTEDAQASRFPEQTTLAAGDEMAASVFGVWGSYSYSDFESDFVFQGTSLAYEADAHNVLAGFDRLFAERFLLGFAFGHQWVESESDFNGGKTETDGFTVAPYAAVLLNEMFSIDATGGYSPLDYDQDRVSPTDGTTTAAEFDSDRWFAAVNLNALKSFDKLVVSARLGYLYTEEEQDGYVETGSAASAAAGTLRTVQQRDIELQQLIVGGEVAYGLGQFEPYVIALYHNDLERDDGEDAGGLPGNFTSVQPDDDDEVNLGFGIRWYSTWGASATFEYSRTEGREDFDNDTFMFTLRAAL